MIFVRIYCTERHPDYEKTYQTVSEFLFENRIDAKITRITDLAIIYGKRILYQPHIVVNNEVVYAGRCPKKEELQIIFKRLKLIK